MSIMDGTTMIPTIQICIITEEVRLTGVSTLDLDTVDMVMAEWDSDMAMATDIHIIQAGVMVDIIIPGAVHTMDIVDLTGTVITMDIIMDIMMVDMATPEQVTDMAVWTAVILMDTLPDLVIQDQKDRLILIPETGQGRQLHQQEARMDLLAQLIPGIADRPMLLQPEQI